MSKSTPSCKVLVGDVLDRLRDIPSESVNCVMTSPPYWGLRDYGVNGQLGLEATLEAYIENLVGVFRELRRVLRNDGVCWLNLGDSYASSPASGGVSTKDHQRTPRRGYVRPCGLKPKDLVGIPWRVAFALQADGWYLRSDVIWQKPNVMPENVKDRPTRSHEYVFLLTKSKKYFYDAAAVAEPSTWDGKSGTKNYRPGQGGKRINAGMNSGGARDTRNRRTVWTITTKPYRGAHFATFPPEIPEICIKAGCPKGGMVLDPFAGSGTTLMVARRLGRNSIGIELNPEYAKLAEARIRKDIGAK